MYPGTVWCTQMLRIATLKKKGRKNIAINIRTSTTAAKVILLVKLRFLFPLLRAIRCPRHETGSGKKKKRQSNYKWGMTGQNCTSLHWLPYILDRRQLTLAHQATFQIGRQFRFPWQPAENGWLEIGLSIVCCAQRWRVCCAQRWRVWSGHRAPARFWTVGAKASHGNGCLFDACFRVFARCAKKKIFNSFTSFSHWKWFIFSTRTDSDGYLHFSTVLISNVRSTLSHFFHAQFLAYTNEELLIQT